MRVVPRLLARSHDLVEDESLVVCVHALVDLVDHAEGRVGHLLQAQQVEHGGHGFLAAALGGAAQGLQRRALAEGHRDENAILGSVGLELDAAAAADALEVASEMFVDRRRHLGDVAQPLRLQLIDLALERVQLALVQLQTDVGLVQRGFLHVVATNDIGITDGALQGVFELYRIRHADREQQKTTTMNQMSEKQILPSNPIPQTLSQLLLARALLTSRIFASMISTVMAP